MVPHKYLNGHERKEKKNIWDFFKSTNSQYFFAKILGLGPWVNLTTIADPWYFW